MPLPLLVAPPPPPSADTIIGSSSQLILDNEEGLAGDGFGRFLAGPGDIDGDGLPELLAGIPYDDALATNDGSARLYPAAGLYGDPPEILLPPDAANSHYFAYGVDGAGDVDGDGYRDLVIGAPGHAEAGTSAGALYLVFGGPTEPEDDDYLRIQAPNPEDWLSVGLAVAGVGDMDGDGRADFAAGSPQNSVGTDYSGRAWLWLGHPGGYDEVVDLPSPAPQDGARYGSAIAGAGDVDCDGYDDVVIGAYGASPTGAAHLLYGAAAGVDGSRGVTLTATISGYFGWAVDGAGDVNADGCDDVIVGTYGDWESGGSAWVYLGSPAGLDRDAQVVLGGSDETQPYMGMAVAGLGDVDGDGYDEVAVGRPYDSAGGTAFLFYGSGAGTDDDRVDALFPHPDVGGSAHGMALTGLGDADRDGHADLAVGDPEAYAGLPNTALVHLYLSCTDEDGDGVCALDDCDDSDRAVREGEIQAWEDHDGDGWGNPRTEQWLCEERSGMADVAGDCDDSNALVHPDAVEEPGDGRDGDCDGTELCRVDVDADGHAAIDELIESADLDCIDELEAAPGSPADDCDDLDPQVHPDAEDEECDGVDADCDGQGGPDDDEDGDGLTWTEEQAARVDPCDADTDGDGLADGQDPDPLIPKGLGQGSDEGCACASGGRNSGLLLPLLALIISGLRRRLPGRTAP